MSPLVSIIVPCYNAASTIERAIRSVRQQRVEHWELILVDDGSSDDTAARISSICDSRIRLIHQENQGPSAARNHGMNLAQGEWLCFLDADDTLLPEALSTLLSAVTPDTDIVVGCYQDITDTGSGEATTSPVRIKGGRLAANTLFWQKHNTGICREVFTHAPVQHKLNLGAPWAKLYRKSFLNQHKLRFNEALVLHEDTLFNHLAYSHTAEVCIIPTPVYCYLDNPNSLTRSQNAHYREHCAAAIGEFSRLHPDFPEELCFFSMFRILECWQGIRSETSHKRSSQLQQLRDFLQNPAIKALVSRMPIKGNLYFSTYDKAELFLIKNKLYFLLVYIMPLIHRLRYLKNKLTRG